MAVLNITPDSFSDGGQLFSQKEIDIDKVLRTVEAMIDEGADIIDLGGESTRPGATPITVQQELDRVIPVLELLSKRFDTIFSVDTSSPEVMLEADRAGAHLINDVRALRREGALDAALETGLPVCLMHMQNGPKSMQHNPQYQNVVSDVINFLDRRKLQCIAAGITSDQILLDPGFGFKKTPNENLEIISKFDYTKFDNLSLIGISRKGFLKKITKDSNLDQTSITTGIISLLNGAKILRVHDVPSTVLAVEEVFG